MTIKLSILDQSPLEKGDTASNALQNTVNLAIKAEKLGYHRFWVSEHHDFDEVAGSSPEVLLSYILAKTNNIRVASGGVMLQHYQPYKVAENFRVLQALAPNRVSLGIGRAPGGLPLSTKALQGENPSSKDSLTQKITDLKYFLNDSLPANHPLSGLTAYPVTQQPVDIFHLGASTDSATQAAKLGLNYVFAAFIQHDAQILEESISTYRNVCINQGQTIPSVSLAVSVIVADTTEEAKALSEGIKIIKLTFESGKKLTVTSLEKAKVFQAESDEKVTIDVQENNGIIAGTKEEVRTALDKLISQHTIDEIIIHTPIKNYQKRARSYELLAEAYVLSVAK